VEFKPLEFSDYPLFQQVLSIFPQRLCCFAPGSLYAWKDVYQYEWASCGPGTILMSFQPVDEEERHLFQPLGLFDADAQALLLRWLEHWDYETMIFNVGEEFLARNPDFVTHFEVENDLGLANYTYATHNLSQLEGGGYRSKRELISKGRRRHEWSIEPLTERARADCLDILKRWGRSKDGAGESQEDEVAATLLALEQLPRFGCEGIILRSEGKPVGFSIFERLNPETAVVHFEKADRDYAGSFETLVQETAKIIAAEGYKFINREEDLGLPGLRSNKMSYRPAEILPAYILKYRL
jgi:uncharacterized protein